MKLNKVIFDLETLLTTFNQADLMQMTESLTNVKEGLEEGRTKLERLSMLSEEEEMVTYIDQQLPILNKNIKTLEIALLTKEAESFEHWIELEELDLHMVCLN